MQTEEDIIKFYQRELTIIWVGVFRGEIMLDRCTRANYRSPKGAIGVGGGSLIEELAPATASTTAISSRR